MLVQDSYFTAKPLRRANVIAVQISLTCGNFPDTDGAGCVLARRNFIIHSEPPAVTFSIRCDRYNGATFYDC